jgi:hypothetical protein
VKSDTESESSGGKLWRFAVPIMRTERPTYQEALKRTWLERDKHFDARLGRDRKQAHALTRFVVDDVSSGLDC